MAEPVRLRVMFGDAGLLKRSQQRRGLQRCLLQLRPDVATIADLAAQIHQNFGLHRSCPHGIIISMDDFVLPPFETTSILKDDDMIMINKNGVAFKDAVKFCGNQYQEQVLQSRDLAHSKKKLAIMDQIIDSIVGSDGDEDDLVLYNGSAVRMVTPQSEKKNAGCKRKRSTELQSSDNTLAIKDSHGDSVADEEDISLHGKIKHKGATSNEMVNANCKKKHTNKFQADKGHLTLPVRHKESSSGEMIQGKQNKKHFDKLLGSDGTLTIEDSQGNSQGDEHDDGLLGIIAHKEVSSNEMMNLKHNRKHLNKLQASNSTLTSKNSHGNSQGDDQDLGLPNKLKSQEESSQCEMSNTKRKKKHSHCHQGSKSEKPTETPSEITNVLKKIHSNKQGASDGTLTIEDSQGNLQREEQDDGLLGIVAHKEATSNDTMNSKHKRKRLNKLQASNTLTSKNSRRDSQGDEEDLGLPNEKKSQEESPQCEMANTKRKKKPSHRHQGSTSEAPTETPSKITNVIKRIPSNKQKTSDGTLTIEDSQGKSKRNEHDDGLFGIIAHKESTSNEMMNSKRKVKHHNKLQASNMLTSNNSQVELHGDEVDLGLPTEKKSLEESPQCEMANTKRKKKYSHRHQGSNGTLTIEDSQENSQRDEHDEGILGIIAHKTATSNEMMNSKHKRKRLNTLQDSNTLASKNSQGDSHGDDENLVLPNEKKSQEESLQCEMTNTKLKKKHSHRPQGSNNTLATANSQGDVVNEDDIKFPNRSEASTETPSKMTNMFKRIHSNKQDASDGTSTIEDSQENSQRDEHEGLLGIIVHKEATSNEMMNSKYKRKRLNKLQDSNTLTSKNSQGDSHGDDEDLGLPNVKKSQEKSSQCDMANTKQKKKHSHGHQGSNNALAIANSQGGVVDEDDINLPNRSEASTETPSKMTNMFKRIHSNKQEASENKFKGIHDVYASMNGVNGDEWKMKSRSARRKKAKKIFYRSQGLKKKMTDNKKVNHSSQNPSMPISHNSVEIQNPESNNQEEPSDYANADQNIDVNINIAPVIVRPGHIRFESSGERSVPKDDPVDTFHWNGITSKKKGQKWGMEKSYYNWNNDSFNLLSCGESDAQGTEVIEVSNEKAAVEEVESHKGSIAEQVEPVIECDENSLSEEPEPQKQLINYESFLPLTRPPEDGDLLIYRVVELSSSWCPELSPFRVGRVSLYDPCSSKIILLPLPEYPLISEETLDEGQESVSLYEEDGTLKIDFSSLVDVRLFKSPESKETTPNFAIEETTPSFPIEETTPNIPTEETTPNFPIEETTPHIPVEETTPSFPIEETTPHIPVEETTPSFPIEETQNDGPVNIQESEACSNQAANKQHIGDGWEAIKLALDEKKAQLEKQNKFDKRRDSSRRAETGPWSYKALRRNALGPTLAILRSSRGD
ncbi:hypothetical protein KSP39_PZI015671 [Platanthera zijinensis]|uniref:Coilin tudor domain-containing protein n=1 Tax=Platanthera zijinensis TaxID=2320716 RepID=A0AAP0B813_9ASPA